MAMLFLVFFHMSLRVQLVAGNDGNKQLGQNLGLAIARATQMMRAVPDENSAEAFQSNVADELYSNQEVLTNPAVAKTVARANIMAEHDVLPGDSVCVRDWDQLCPDGWDGLGDKCSAPSSYAGGCATLQSFASMSGVAKANFAASCKAPWPCKGEGCLEGHDYESCPIGWEPAGNRFCRVKVGEEVSKCPGIFNFHDMDATERQDTAKACALEWRCKATCARDFSAPCPEEWAEMSDLCFAPATYAGGCGYTVNTTLMTDIQKQAFAQQCVVQFPCVQQTAQKKVHMASHAQMPSENGPIVAQTGRVASPAKDHKAVEIDERLAQFKDRFVVPSGPLDAHGDIHF